MIVIVRKSKRYTNTWWSLCNNYEDYLNFAKEMYQWKGEDAWWRSSNGSVLYSLDKGEVTINNQKMIGWIRKPWDEEISKDINYQSLSEYLCEFIGASMPKNVVACAMDLAKFNHLLMGELFEKYEPVEE